MPTAVPPQSEVRPLCALQAATRALLRPKPCPEVPDNMYVIQPQLPANLHTCCGAVSAASLRPPAAGWQAGHGALERLHADECHARLSPGCDPAPFARHPRLDTLGPTLRPSRLPIPSPWPALTAGRGPDPAPRLASPRARASPPGSCDALRADGCARRRSRLFSRRRRRATSPPSSASWRSAPPSSASWRRG